MGYQRIHLIIRGVVGAHIIRHFYQGPASLDSPVVLDVVRLLKAVYFYFVV